jgi:cytochrome c oxidase subunit 1
MGISALYGMFAGIYHWFQECLENVKIWVIFTFGLLLFVLMVYFPYAFYRFSWFARRYYTNTNFPLFDDLQNVNVLITTFALIGGAFHFLIHSVHCILR